MKVATSRGDRVMALLKEMSSCKQHMFDKNDTLLLNTIG